MKRLFGVFAFVSFFVLCSCSSMKPLSKAPSDNNKSYEVSYLFEHEGCKVYRFQDMGNYVYFTNCKGNVTAINPDSTKKRVETIVSTDLILNQ